MNAPVPGNETSRAKAYLQLYEPPLTGDLYQPGAEMEKIPFQFNPKDWSLTKSAKWDRKPAKQNESSGIPQYLGPEPSKTTLEMFFDCSDKQDNSVVIKTKKLLECCRPTAASLRHKKGVPPWVVFHWGELVGVHCYISSVKVNYTLFTAAGLPVRAVCTVSLEEVTGEPPKLNPTSGGEVPQRQHTVIEGDTLAGIAFAEYANPALWRRVAEANNIDDPSRLRPGTAVLLPSIDELLRPDTTYARPSARQIAPPRSRELVNAGRH